MTEERKTFIFLSSFFTIMFLFSIFNVFVFMNGKNVNKNDIPYEINSKIDYLVFINKNDFIDKTILPAGETYISSITDKINMNMEYNYEAKKKLPITLSYKIVANIIGIYNLNPTERDTNPIIWKKEHTIKEFKEENYESIDKISIKENFDIDWHKYNDEILKFKEHFTMPLLSKLEVKMIVNLNVETEEYNLKETKEVTAYMPLTEQIFAVDAILNDKEQKNLTPKNNTFLIDNQRKLGVYGFTTILSLFLAIVSIKKLTMFKKTKSFQSKIEDIKKEYNDVIVETKNMLSLKGLKPIAITSFDEMLNLADSFITPIILYEEKHLACFYIVKDEVMYMFVIKEKQPK